MAIHIPLNNHIQSIKIENLNYETLADERFKLKENEISLIIFEQALPFLLACYYL